MGINVTYGLDLQLRRIRFLDLLILKIILSAILLARWAYSGVTENLNLRQASTDKTIGKSHKEGQEHYFRERGKVARELVLN